MKDGTIEAEVPAVAAAGARPAAKALDWTWSWPSLRDPRVPFALILTFYAVLGCTVLTFSRDPFQMALTVVSACLLDTTLSLILRRQLVVPLSAYITGLSLALLLNYAHGSLLLFLPVYLAIGSKYVFTYNGRHVFNPSMFGVAVSLLLGGDLITTAPAYQWGGTWAMSAFMVTMALAFFVFNIGRNALILSFLGFYLIQISLRAYIMRWYLPPEALLLGTLTSAPFYLFVFYMITDPQTSPSTKKGQIATALALTLVDLYFHRLTSLYTFFYAALAVGASRFLYLHLKSLWYGGMAAFFRDRLWSAESRRAYALVGGIGAGIILLYKGAIYPDVREVELGFGLVEVKASHSGIDAKAGNLLDRADPRVQHVAKWLLSAGDAVAAGDYDNDGLLDLFVTNLLKDDADRNALYRNLGNFRFARVEVPALAAVSFDPVNYGAVSGALFLDYDNDGDQDLFLSVGYGKSRLLRNQLAEKGVASFIDATAESGLDEYTISIAANALDFDRDGRLDLFIANALSPYLESYTPPRPLNIFALPKPEYPGDRRMFPFMHRSWDNARNGGLNALYRNAGGGRFAKIDMTAFGMPETHWSLAVGTGDLNNDGWTDLYIANDFGPDDLYLNEQGKRFQRVSGRLFGSVGRDTYKGMNSSLGDIDRNGYLDIYVSNVHVPLQAEGSLLWMTYPSKDRFQPVFRDEAWRRGALNEHRFGWGGALGDLNNDGWLDIVQVNGMVDDTLDKRYPDCPSYWYVNEKLMRSGPEIHTYVDMWGDLRGYCINGRERNRVYLSRGDKSKLQFIDVAAEIGWKETYPSRGALLADLDNDGDLDVAITHMVAPLSLYRNSLYDGADGANKHWIGFKLEGSGQNCNRDAAGTKVRVAYVQNGKRVRQLREVQIANAFAAQGDRRAHFGLGEFAGPVDAEISWCGAPPEIYRGLAVDRYHALKQRQ
ncbi:MAG TPA: FG-GAP-like repeat-containing protein [Candidatus Acidoferrales bacterium]|nr:FG-GAP-like repeat-containing protein [Candidatus Acidoferrales bacterium]